MSYILYCEDIKRLAFCILFSRKWGCFNTLVVYACFCTKCPTITRKKRTKQITFRFHGNRTRILQCGKIVYNAFLLIWTMEMFCNGFMHIFRWSQVELAIHSRIYFNSHEKPFSCKKIRISPKELLYVRCLIGRCTVEIFSFAILYYSSTCQRHSDGQHTWK